MYKGSGAPNFEKWEMLLIGTGISAVNNIQIWMNMNILKLPTAVPLIEAVSDSETVSDEVVSCPTKKYCTTMYNISLLWRGKMFTAKTEESAHPHLNLVPQRGQEELFSTFSDLLFILTSLLCLALRTIYWFIICGWKFTVRTTNTWQLAVLGFLWRWTLKAPSTKS